ncbi:MAG: hypothetical protein DMD73_08210 [Gemmatimonadetes bacterium]|nr:MAG: hypothetical protein DMD73_08210 [Gemmatimonadota bacterium]
MQLGGIPCGNEPVATSPRERLAVGAKNHDAPLHAARARARRHRLAQLVERRFPRQECRRHASPGQPPRFRHRGGERVLELRRVPRHASGPHRRPAALDPPHPQHPGHDHGAEHETGEGDGARQGIARPSGGDDRGRQRRGPRGPGPHRRRPVEPLGRGDGHGAARERYVSPPLHLKTLVPDEVRFILERDARLLVPVGTCEQHGPHLPLGCDTIIVECLADDLSGALEILRAPTIEYGVNTSTQRPFPGNASVRRKTLHRWMNDLLGSWEQAGVDTFIILTAHGHDPHQEALSTLRTHQARIFTVDVFDLDFSGLLEDGDGPMHGSELDTSLLLYLAPDLVRMERAQDFLLPERQLPRYQRTRLDALPKGSPGSLGRPSLATREKGERLYKMIRERIATRVLGAPVP